MTLTRKRFSSIYAIVMIAVSANSAPTLRWAFETSRPTSPSWDVYRGETVLLQPTMLADGVAVEYAANATATLWYQTNGMGAAWWSAPASVVSNIVSASWTPVLDPGGAAVTFFVGVSEGGAISYRANGSLNFLDAPGAVPNTLVLPELITAIDFDLITPVNAPWATPAAVSNIVDAAGGGTGSIDIEVDPKATPIATNALEKVTNHISRVNNPHNVTAAQSGALSLASVSTATVGRAGSAGRIETTLGIDEWLALESGRPVLHRREQTGEVPVKVVSSSKITGISVGATFFLAGTNQTTTTWTNNLGSISFSAGGTPLSGTVVGSVFTGLGEFTFNRNGDAQQNFFVTNAVSPITGLLSRPVALLQDIEGIVVEEKDPLSVHTAGGTMTGPFKLAETGLTFQGVNIDTNFTFRAEWDGTNLNFNVYMEAK